MRGKLVVGFIVEHEEARDIDAELDGLHIAAIIVPIQKQLEQALPDGFRVVGTSALVFAQEARDVWYPTKEAPRYDDGPPREKRPVRDDPQA